MADIEDVIGLEIEEEQPESPIGLEMDGEGGEDLEMAVQVDGDYSALRAEAWAVGKQNGEDVPETDATYHNNSKYYAQQAAGSAATASSAGSTAATAATQAQGSATAADGSATDAAGSATAAAASATAAEGSAEAAEDYATDAEAAAQEIEDQCFVIETGVITAFPKTITDSRITEEYIVLDEIPSENVDIGWVTTAGKIILYGSLPAGQTVASQKLKLHRCAGLTQNQVEITARLVQVTSANGNYLVADAKNLIPGTQYTWRLYEIRPDPEHEGEEIVVNINAIGSIAHTPDTSRWYQEATYSLVGGRTYYMTIASTGGAVKVSNNVEFVSGITPAAGGE